MSSTAWEVWGEGGSVGTHHHAEADFLTPVLLFDRLVQNNIQEDIVAAEDADDLAAAVELHKQALVEVLVGEEARLARGAWAYT